MDKDSSIRILWYHSKFDGLVPHSSVQHAINLWKKDDIRVELKDDEKYFGYNGDHSNDHININFNLIFDDVCKELDSEQ